ncbi:MAG: amidohydrolase [Solirubrobacterales bacterium]
MTAAVAETAILGARVRTQDPARPFVAAVAWRDGTIVAVGDEAEVREACDASTTLIDGAGTTVTPGLVDAHIHPFLAEETRGADLTAVRTRAQLVEALRGHRAEHPEEEWLLGWGLDYGALESPRIDAAPLLEAVGDLPVLVTTMDFHTGIATPAALARAGATGAERFESGSVVVAEAGAPTGELREAEAIELVRGAVPALDAAAERRLAIARLASLNACGITGAHVMNGDLAGLAALRELEAAGDLSVRLIHPFTISPDLGPEELAALLVKGEEAGRRWRGGVAKFFVDGVIESGTAWLYEPDSEGMGQAPFWPTAERYAEAVRSFAAAGFQCVTHAIGDRAVGFTLDTYASAAPARGGAPHRIEHLETLDPRDLARFGAGSPAASMQPLHMQWREPDGGGTFADRLGPERAARAFQVRSILDRGATVALGSDWPVAQYDPRIGMAWARLRRAPGRPDLAPFEPEQRLSGAEALAGYTTGAAAIVGEAHLAGRIAAGRRADLTAFAADPAEIDADELPALPVLLTVVDGEVVRRAER